MPKISDAHREMRRAQILDAAWRCFYREGVQATTMEQIIKEADMSASAMYRYFGGKDDIIFSAISSSLTAVGKLLEPIVARDLAPAVLVERVTSDIETFSHREGYNLAAIAMHGWSEAQRDEKVRELIRGFYLGFREQLVARVVRWQAEGAVAPDADVAEVAKALQSIILGYVVQMSIMRDVDPAAHARGLAALLGAGR
ncbi:TetR/AcrR family transcriptional regulator [Paraburkholderia sp. J12]|uniref:TetR/AcrR family transcriptional regulator n=1 Tax=Paraburkholderia sp. J12 TaxID=2805432 RepID=UPI002ABD3391|nr:TetR family transcriptional regulator [Paraburkholderia sp. J12]